MCPLKGSTHDDSSISSSYYGFSQTTATKDPEFADVQRKGTSWQHEAKKGEAEIGSRARRRAWGRTWPWCPHSMGYLHHLHVLLLHLCQARQHFQSLSWAAGKEKEALRAKSAMHIPLQFAVHMELLMQVHITLVFLDGRRLQLFQKNIESIYPSKIKYRRKETNSYRTCLHSVSASLTQNWEIKPPGNWWKKLYEPHLAYFKLIQMLHVAFPQLTFFKDAKLP